MPANLSRAWRAPTNCRQSRRMGVTPFNSKPLPSDLLALVVDEVMAALAGEVLHLGD